jgi:ATP-binding cassette subfamily B protein
MVRRRTRLVILDEPARGLERTARREFIGRAREQWREATLIYITHDVRDAVAFDRIVAVEEGRIAEDGRPEDLMSIPEGCYRRLCTAELMVREELQSAFAWRRLRMEQGRLLEEVPLPSYDKEDVCRPT